MSMSTYIKAFIPDTDKEYQKHKMIWEVCDEANVSLPKETEEYFKGYNEPEEKLEVVLIKNIHYCNYDADSQNGFEVDLTKLPEGVTKLRFINSY